MIPFVASKYFKLKFVLKHSILETQVHQLGSNGWKKCSDVMAI